MTKDELKEIVQVCIENTWYKRQSFDPIGEQTEFLTDALWSRLTPFVYQEQIIPYIKIEKDLQIEKMKQLGINTNGQIFEQMVNTVIYMLEEQQKK